MCTISTCMMKIRESLCQNICCVQRLGGSLLRGSATYALQLRYERTSGTRNKGWRVRHAGQDTSRDIE